MLTVIADIRTRPGLHHREAVLEAFKKLLPTVLQEPGCHGYAPLTDTHAHVDFQSIAPDSVVVIEKWESIVHLQAHLATPHMQAFNDQVKNDVLDRHIRILKTAI